MSQIRHDLTETEIACDVTLEQVAELRPKVLVRHDFVVVPADTAPALATSVSRYALGAPASYVGRNHLGLPVYRRVKTDQEA